MDVVAVELARDPVEDVEPAVQTQREEVVAVYNGGNGRLSKEEELGENADRLEDVGQIPKPLLVDKVRTVCSL